MTSRPCAQPVELGELVDYLLGELEQSAARVVEEHIFECGSCADRLQSVHRIGESIADAVRHAEVGANVNDAVVARALRDGLSVREYRIAPGEAVPCTAGPEDLVAVRLSGDFEGISELTMDTAVLDLESEQLAPTVSRPVLADRDGGEIVLLFPGDVVRSYRRSRWTMTVHGESASGRREIGTFVMDHTP